MPKDNLKLTIAEAIRFVEKAMVLKDTPNPSQYEKAQVKRASMDLSRALITLRKEGMDT